MPCNDCSRAETCPPCINEDARFELFNELRQWMHSHTANALIDAFAHQLAEKQREHAEAEWPGDEYPAVLRRVIAGHQADLIDPKSREELRP